MKINNSPLQSLTKEPLRQNKTNSNFKPRGLVCNNRLVTYAFSDVNCSFILKLKDNTFHYFNK